MLLRLDCHYPLQQFLDPEDWYKRILITNDEIMRIKNKAGVSRTAVLSAMVYEIMVSEVFGANPGQTIYTSLFFEM